MTTIPMSQPDITDVEVQAVIDVLRTSVLALGPRAELFERKLAARLDAPHAVAVSSGTAGLHLCMIAAGVGENDLVVTTPFSFVASANCILYERARPVFVDVDPTTLTIDPEALARTLRGLRRAGGAAAGRVRAILPVHVFGQAADMDPILALGRAHGIPVIEDACEAIGAGYRGRPVGSLGEAGVFAFYPNKQITTGEGGMIVTHDGAWDTLCRSLRNQGRDVFDGWLAHTRLGYNYRLDELSAALGVAQIDRLDEILARRAQVAAWYMARLTDVEELTLPVVASWTTRMSWFVYVVRLAAVDRDAVIAALAERGVPARAYFPPVHLQPFYRQRFGYKPGDFPIAERAGACALALPFFGTMTEAQVDTVCGALREVLRDAATRRAMRASA
ncbi:MAG: DegT/DnrJ/EryC1/StrS family aminotransferase [Deltaproteobacteria bacterium]|nr:DegT/DnrJ/EryC1/StrS family aminotransferase [Deltaproteobacteria bacterium]